MKYIFCILFSNLAVRRVRGTVGRILRRLLQSPTCCLTASATHHIRVLLGTTKWSFARFLRKPRELLDNQLPGMGYLTEEVHLPTFSLRLACHKRRNLLEFVGIPCTENPEIMCRIRGLVDSCRLHATQAQNTSIYPRGLPTPSFPDFDATLARLGIS